MTKASPVFPQICIEAGVAEVTPPPGTESLFPKGVDPLVAVKFYLAADGAPCFAVAPPLHLPQVSPAARLRSEKLRVFCSSAPPRRRRGARGAAEPPREDVGGGGGEQRLVGARRGREAGGGACG